MTVSVDLSCRGQPLLDLGQRVVMAKAIEAPTWKSHVVLDHHRPIPTISAKSNATEISVFLFCQCPCTCRTLCHQSPCRHPCNRDTLRVGVSARYPNPLPVSLCCIYCLKTVEQMSRRLGVLAARCCIVPR